MDVTPGWTASLTLFHSRNNCSHPNRFEILLPGFRVSTPAEISSHPAQEHHDLPLASGIPVHAYVNTRTIPRTSLALVRQGDPHADSSRPPLLPKHVQVFSYHLQCTPISLISKRVWITVQRLNHATNLIPFKHFGMIGLTLASWTSCFCHSPGSR